jgi:hypothetical protein
VTQESCTVQLYCTVLHCTVQHLKPTIGPEGALCLGCRLWSAKAWLRMAFCNCLQRNRCCLPLLLLWLWQQRHG